MPYRTTADLPKAQTDQYTEHQKKAFLEAFNSAYDKYKDDESHAFAIAHSAAKKAGKNPPGSNH
jgi:cation transport regulator